MARAARRVFAGFPHLVVQYAAAGAIAFRGDVDRLDYLAAVRESGLYDAVTLHGYALLDTVVMLLVTPSEEGGLGSFMRKVNRRFVPAVHRRYGTRGLLWGSRFQSTAVEPERYLHVATLWIEQAAVRAGLVADALEWSWSSARHHAGHGHSTLIKESPRWWQLGNTPFEREARHNRLLQERLSAVQVAAIESAVRSGWPLGSPTFLSKLTGGSDLGLKRRARGRPKVAD